MRNLRRLVTAMVLTLVLALPASAGYISTGIANQPPPPPPTAAEGDVSIGAADERLAGGGETNDPFTGALLTLFEGMLSLL